MKRRSTQVIIFLSFLFNVCLNGQYHLYDDDDCLDFYVDHYSSEFGATEIYHGKQHQIISFCRYNSYTNDQFVVNELEIPSIRFEELKLQNISSLQLYAWSIHMGLIEEYQAILENKNRTDIVSSNASIFNCSLIRKFGRYCQYSFNNQLSFVTYAKNIFKKSRLLETNGTCYWHMNCKRNNKLWCLDWREICDGVVHCWPDPVDEQYCQILEQNECTENEYRCFNGQCIPKTFSLDKTIIPDCIDYSDEDLVVSKQFQKVCGQNGDPSFRCTDVMCHHWRFSVDDVQNSLCGPIHSRQKYYDQVDQDLLSLSSNKHISEKCWAVMICLTQVQYKMDLNHVNYEHLFNGTCDNICKEPEISCSEKMRDVCPPLFEFPSMSFGWAQLHFVYSWNRTNQFPNLPDYICYDERYCSFAENKIRFIKLSDPSIILSCQFSNISNLRGNWFMQIKSIQKFMHVRCTLGIAIRERHCFDKIQFQCDNKCLSKHRLVDYLRDCDDGSDEQYNDSCHLNDQHRLQCTLSRTGITQCIPKTNILLGNKNDCKSNIKLPHFPTLCNGYVEYYEKYGNDAQTDETDCEEWQCDNQYTRCNGIWNCRNGIDEANCFHQICNGTLGHPCLIANTIEFMCLPINKISDGKVDCLGATDEQQICRTLCGEQSQYRCYQNSSRNMQFENITEICIPPTSVCDQEPNCPLADDELLLLCKNPAQSEAICSMFWTFDRRITKENIMCTLDDIFAIPRTTINTIQQFSLANYSIMSPMNLRSTRTFRSNVKEEMEIITNNQRQIVPLTDIQCHGGIPVYVRDTIECLCPPSLYGRRCENQNERISITLQIGAPEWRTPFVFVIYLIDDSYGIINSYHQIRYLSIRDCNTKFNFNLLYGSRPKHSDRSYSIRIDAFEMFNLEYRGSWTFPILYPFLPVYRLAIQLTLPFGEVSPAFNCPIRCQTDHGQCFSFINTKKYFCLCNAGWTGPTCTDSFQCECSPDSICVGNWKNRSVCICPTHKFGRRCYLKNDYCERSSVKQCQNDGYCIPRDIRILADPLTICSCPDGFHGEQCEMNETRIDIEIAMPVAKDSLLIHFITVDSYISSQPYIPSQQRRSHDRATTFKRIPIDTNEVTVFWKDEFNLMFVEYDHQFYLVFVQLKYVESTHLKTKLEPKKRCPSIQELLNKTILDFPRLKRVKYYHKPCQQQTNLECFHDEDQFICLCTYDRRANCFTFDHQMKYSCQQLSYCENGGSCYQNNLTCPTNAMCVCPKCYLGSRCQLSTKTFGLTLDIILGHQIRSGLSFSQQPSSVMISLIITILMFIIGLINGCLCIITFKQKDLLQVGCGIYLLTVSIVSILTMTIFMLKFFALTAIEMMMIKNRHFLLSQCIILDFLLKIFLQIEDWLHATVAIERLISIMKGSHFNTKLSKKMAKWIILIIVIGVISTSIQEPIYRILIDDVDEGRTWCIVRYPDSYSNSLNLFTSIATLIHFIGPFVINIISALGIICMLAKRRSHLHRTTSLKTHFIEQFDQHKNLVISPIALIILALPRIILTFQLECMQSAREPITLFLIGYFISFLPPLFLFTVFVIPSKYYRKTFKETLPRW